LLKQRLTVSKCAAQRGASMPVATTAFSRRAPSRCVRRPLCRAQPQIASTVSKGWILPPPRLCVFSIVTRRVREAWTSSGRIRFWTCSRCMTPSRPVPVRATAPQKRAYPPCS